MLIMLTSCALGITHALITPAWANVEEAGHFEYMRFVVEHGSLPRDGETDSDIQQRIRESFVWKHHRWGSAGRMANRRLVEELRLYTDADWLRLRDDLEQLPGYEDITPDTLTAVPQSEEPPGYYLYAALFQFLIPARRIETQLLVARLSSVLLGALTIWLAYRTSAEMFPGSRYQYVRIGVPALVGLLPSFVVLASAVNNTIAAAAAVSLLIFACARLIRHGFSPGRLLLVLGGAAACLLSKPSAYWGLLLAVAALPLSTRQAWPKWSLPATLVVCVSVPFILLSWQWPMSWYHVPDRAAPLRPDAPVGKRVIDLGFDGEPHSLFQMIPAHIVRRIRGETVTLGAWVRRDPAAEATLPSLWAAANEEKLTPLPLRESTPVPDGEWSFHAATLTIPADTQCLAVRLGSEQGEEGSMALYDGLVLALGERPLDELPSFSDRFAERGTWGGEPFANVILNGSAERGQPLLRPEVQRFLPPQLARYLNLNPRLASFTDWRANWPAFNQSVRWLFTSFWSRFASANPGLPRNAVLALGVLSILSGLGMVVFAVRLLRGAERWQQRELALVLLAAVMAVGSAVLRLDAFVFPGHCDFYQGRFISTGYYIIPGALPLLTVWYLGLEQWVPRRWHRWLLVAAVLSFYFMTVGSLLGRQIPDFLLAYGLAPKPTAWAWLWGWAP